MARALTIPHPLHASGDLCLRCGREGHSSQDCERPIPAWPAEAAFLMRVALTCAMGHAVLVFLATQVLR